MFPAERPVSFHRRQSLWLALAAILAALAFRAGRLDAWSAALWYDPVARRFPLRDDFFLVAVMHHGLRAALLVAALAVAAWTAWQWRRRSPSRRAWLAASLTLLLAPLLVSMLKAATDRDCPWDLATYGGDRQERVEWLTPRPPGETPGRCFPAGHASGGFAWFGLALPWRGRRGFVAIWLAAFALGAAMGVVQEARGAHFSSHTFWSAWCCWAVAVGVDWSLNRESKRRFSLTTASAPSAP